MVIFLVQVNLNNVGYVFKSSMILCKVTYNTYSFDHDFTKYVMYCYSYLNTANCVAVPTLLLTTLFIRRYPLKRSIGFYSHNKICVASVILNYENL